MPGPHHDTVPATHNAMASLQPSSRVALVLHQNWRLHIGEVAVHMIMYDWIGNGAR